MSRPRGMRPEELSRQARPDGTSDIFTVTRSNGIGLLNLGPRERFIDFAAFFTEGYAGNQMPYAVEPIGPGETQTLMDIDNGDEMPFTANEDENLQVYKWWDSLSTKARISMIVGGSEITTIDVGVEGWQFEQEPALFNLYRFDPDLTGQTTLEWKITNLDGNNDLTGGIFSHAIGIADFESGGR